MNFDEIHSYWDDRAAQDNTIQSTTQDVYLRDIELRVLADKVSVYEPKSIADIGCGDGRTTIGLAEKFEQIALTGYDYSESMISNARRILANRSIGNVSLGQHDVCNPLPHKFDLIYTTRCLINLPTWELQMNAIKNIHASLNDGGVYLMIENFVDGQDEFNRVRRSFDLPEIPIRDHNNFFEIDSLASFASDYFDLIDEVNISSTYYLVSRVVYAKMCADKNITPDYYDVHHKYASRLPYVGNCGPVKLICFKKKAN